MTSQKKKFNKLSQQVFFPAVAFDALADWWACQLFAKKDNTSKPGVTVQQSFAFMKALVVEMRTLHCDLNPNGLRYIRVQAYDPSVLNALTVAGIENKANALPRGAQTYLYEDGQVFVPTERALQTALVYEGQPSIMLVSPKSVDLSDAVWMRQQRKFLFVPLTEGQEYKTVLEYHDGLSYTPRIARKNEVLIVHADTGVKNFDALTQQDVLNPEKRRDITSVMVRQMSEYTDGAKNGSWTVQVLDHCYGRVLSAPLMIKKTTQAFAIGTGYEYDIARPGDTLEITIDKIYGGLPRIEIIRQEWCKDTPHPRYVACLEDGTVLENSKPATKKSSLSP